MLSRAEVARRFVAGESGSNANMRIEKKGEQSILFSYATPIAWREPESLILSEVKYSQTTTRQQKAIYRAARDEGYRAVVVGKRNTLMERVDN